MKISQHPTLTKFSLLLALTLASHVVEGQNNNISKITSTASFSENQADLMVDKRTSELTRYYYQEVEVPKELINGKEYEPYYTRSRVKPLLFPERTRTASIITKTRKYNNLTLDYDTFLDQVIYTDTSQTINYRFPQISLNTDIVEGFNLYFNRDSAVFKFFRHPECDELNLEEGFYEQAYMGKTQFIIRHESTYYMREAINNYKYSPKIYVSTGGPFQRINKGGNLLKLFGEKSDVMKDYIHSAKIKIRKVDKPQMIRILKHYDSL